MRDTEIRLHDGFFTQGGAEVWNGQVQDIARSQEGQHEEKDRQLRKHVNADDSCSISLHSCEELSVCQAFIKHQTDKYSSLLCEPPGVSTFSEMRPTQN